MNHGTAWAEQDFYVATASGAWQAPLGESGHAVFVLGPSGEFIFVDYDPAHGVAGIEAGSYVAQHLGGGVSLDVLLDTDGDRGFSMLGGASIAVAQNILYLPGPSFSTVEPEQFQTGSLIGTWMLGHSAWTDQDSAVYDGDDGVVSFFDDGTFVAGWVGAAGHPEGTGIEAGTYEWNPATGALFLNMTLDQNGPTAGLSKFGIDGVDLTRGALTFSVWPDFVTTLGVNAALFGDNLIQGTPGNDALAGLQGFDNINGGGGIDTAFYAGLRSRFEITHGEHGVDWSVVDTTGDLAADSLFNVERLAFRDGNLALDLDGNAGRVARVLGAVGGTGAVHDMLVVGRGLALADGGMDERGLVSVAMHERFGDAPDAALLLGTVFANVAGRAPTQAELQSMLDVHAAGASFEAMVQFAADSDMNAQHVGLAELAEQGLPYLFVY